MGQFRSTVSFQLLSTVFRSIV